jgi:hypothetical protein
MKIDADWRPFLEETEARLAKLPANRDDVEQLRAELSEIEQRHNVLLGVSQEESTRYPAKRTGFRSGWMFWRRRGP